MAQLPIHGYPNGKTKEVVGHTIVDDEILPLVKDLSWYMGGQYAATSIKGVQKYLHYFVWEHFEGPDSIPDDLQLDHLNQDKLDNRIANLVFVENRVKQANAPKRVDNTSGYKSVCERKGKYYAGLRRDTRFVHLGSYATVEEAAYAVNLGYAKLHPEVPTPNLEAEALLTAEQKITVEANVQRLTRPGRLPNQS